MASISVTFHSNNIEQDVCKLKLYLKNPKRKSKGRR